MAADASSYLGTRADKMLVASTGIIGHRLPIEKVRSGIKEAAKRLGTDNDVETIHAIMTTDTREKTAVVQGRIDGKLVTVAGIVKGAGMIAPLVATMIAVITTDAAVAPGRGTSPCAMPPPARSTPSPSIAIPPPATRSWSWPAARRAIARSPCPKHAGPASFRRGSQDYRKFAGLLGEVCEGLAARSPPTARVPPRSWT